MTGAVRGNEGSAPRPVDAWYARHAAALLIVGVALFIASLDNLTLWRLVFRVTSVRGDQWPVALSVFAVLFCPVVIGLSLSLGTRNLKIVAILGLLASSIFGFLMSLSGYTLHPALVRDVFDSAVIEPPLFLSAAFVTHVFAFGIAPSLAVAAVPIPRLRWRTELVQRAVLGAFCLALLLGAVRGNSVALSSFAEQYGAVRVLVNPAYPTYSAARRLIATASADDGADRGRRQ